MKKNLTKIALIAMSVVILGLAIAVGTLAYLKDTTQTIKNVFVVGDGISILLKETEGEDYYVDDVLVPNAKSFKIIPGKVVAKDPTITVEGGSEKCYVFVKVATNLVNSADVEDEVPYDATWGIADGWSKLTVTGLETDETLYYRVQNATAVDAEYSVLKDDELVISNDGIVTIAEGTQVYMEFTGYAIQYDALAAENATVDPDVAWGMLQDELSQN